MRMCATVVCSCICHHTHSLNACRVDDSRLLGLHLTQCSQAGSPDSIAQGVATTLFLTTLTSVYFCTPHKGHRCRSTMYSPIAPCATHERRGTTHSTVGLFSILASAPLASGNMLQPWRGGSRTAPRSKLFVTASWHSRSGRMRVRRSTSLVSGICPLRVAAVASPPCMYGIDQCTMAMGEPAHCLGECLFLLDSVNPTVSLCVFVLSKGRIRIRTGAHVERCAIV